MIYKTFLFCVRMRVRARAIAQTARSLARVALCARVARARGAPAHARECTERLNLRTRVACVCVDSRVGDSFR